MSKEGSENDKFQDKNATLVSEPILGSYCLSNYSRLEDIEKEEECNLKPCRGIIICKGTLFFVTVIVVVIIYVRLLLFQHYH